MTDRAEQKRHSCEHAEPARLPRRDARINLPKHAESDAEVRKRVVDEARRISARRAGHHHHRNTLGERARDAVDCRELAHAVRHHEAAGAAGGAGVAVGGVGGTELAGARIPNRLRKENKRSSVEWDQSLRW